MIYKAIHFQTQEVKIGNYEELSELDIRQWTLEPYYQRELKPTGYLIIKGQLFLFARKHYNHLNKHLWENGLGLFLRWELLSLGIKFTKKK